MRRAPKSSKPAPASSETATAPSDGAAEADAFEADLVTLKQRLEHSTAKMHEDIEALSRAPLQSLAESLAAHDSSASTVSSDKARRLSNCASVAKIFLWGQLTNMARRVNSSINSRRMAGGAMAVIVLLLFLCTFSHHSETTASPPSMFAGPQGNADLTKLSWSAFYRQAIAANSSHAPHSNASSNTSIKSVSIKSSPSATFSGGASTEQFWAGHLSESSSEEHASSTQASPHANPDVDDGPGPDALTRGARVGDHSPSPSHAAAAAKTIVKTVAMSPPQQTSPPPPPSGKACTPLNKIDSNMERCDASCAAAAAKFHCKLCKCHTCAFCLQAAAAVTPPSSSAASAHASAAAAKAGTNVALPSTGVKKTAATLPAGGAGSGKAGGSVR